MILTGVYAIRLEGLYLVNKRQTTVLCIGDCHVGAKTFNEELFERWLSRARTAKRKGRSYILLNGDLIDFQRATQDAWGSTMSATEQIDYIVEALEPYTDLILGATSSNHGCFDEETELLTSDGWKFIKDCDEQTVFATINPETHNVEYQLPIKIYKENYKGKMLEYENKGVSFKTTPNHRFVYKGSNSNIWNIDELPDFREIDMLCAGFNDLLYSDELTDEEVKLIAWCLTDAHRNKYGCWRFFQSEPNNERLEDLLNHFGFKFNKSNVGDVNGVNKDGKGRKTAYTYDLNKEDSLKIDELCDSHVQIPESIFDLDKRQFDIFLKEVVFCDGSFDKGSYVVYKSKEFLDQLQILCTKNGYRTILKEYRPTHWRLYCNPKRNSTRVVLTDVEEVDYDGLIFCATMENDTLISRRNGKVLITGNSRAYKEFNMDIDELIANKLGVPYGYDMFADIPFNSTESKRIFWKHGTRFSKSYLLFFRNFINDMSSINADMFFVGHAHFGGHQTRIIREADGISKKEYIANGSFLSYKDSYANKAGFDLNLACFPVVSIDEQGNVNCKMEYEVI